EPQVIAQVVDAEGNPARSGGAPLLESMRPQREVGLHREGAALSQSIPNRFARIVGEPDQPPETIPAAPGRLGVKCKCPPVCGRPRYDAPQAALPLFLVRLHLPTA